jgi:hypothetical protein
MSNSIVSAPAAAFAAAIACRKVQSAGEQAPASSAVDLTVNLDAEAGEDSAGDAAQSMGTIASTRADLVRRKMPPISPKTYLLTRCSRV